MPNELSSLKRSGAMELNYDDLLEHQQQILKRVIAATHKVALESAVLESASKESEYQRIIDSAHPSFAFLIDGARGSGKTSLLLTIRRVTNLLGDGSLGENDSKIISDIRGVNQKTRIKLQQALQVDTSRRKVLHALPAIFPEHMETSESVMENIIAQMAISLQLEIDKLENNDNRSIERRQTAEKLIDRIRKEVAKGWYFSRRLGVEALMKDSINFESYIKARATHAQTSHNRIQLWRRFVRDYLDFFGAQMLGIFIDDTDTAQNSLTKDVLHSIRVYLQHPRIITVLAANLQSLANRLLTDSYDSISNSARVLRSPDSFTAKIWREHERDQIDEFLSKILPQHLRNFIKPATSDFARIYAKDFKSFMESYLRRKFNTLHQAKKYKPENIEAHTRSEIENYMSMWLLRAYYAGALIPHSPRQLNNFRSQLSDRQTYKAYKFDNTYNKKRVAVVLYDSPQNYALKQRISESDSSVIAWLIRQQVQSVWRGTRRITLNKLEIPEDSYAFNFIFFRFDLEIAYPLQRRSPIRLPREMLPVPGGRNINVPEVWETERRQEISEHLEAIGFNLPSGELRLRQRLFGVADFLSSPVVAANCIYMKDLMALPDVLWEGQGRDISWGDYPIRSATKLFMFNREDVRTDYFVEVVMLYASIPISEPIPATEFTRASETHDLKNIELKGAATVKESDEGIGSRADADKDLQPLMYVAGHFQSVVKDNPIESIDIIQTTQDEAREMVYGRGLEFFPRMEQVVAENIKASLAEQPASSQDMFAPDVLTSELIRYQIPPEITSDSFRINNRQQSHNLTEPADIQRQNTLIAHVWRSACNSCCGDFVSYMAPRYHRIANDVRRSYCAIRIFEHEVKTLAENLTVADNNSSANGAAGEESYVNRAIKDHVVHRRDDRIRVYGIEKIRRCFGLQTWDRKRGETQIRQYGRRPVYTYIFNKNQRVLHQYCPKLTATNYFNLSAISADLPNSPLSTGDLFSSAQAKLAEVSEHIRRERNIFEDLQHADIGDDWRCFFDPTSEDPRILRQQADRGRAYRVGLLLLWGLGPTLTSLIHLDIMGEVYWQKNPRHKDRDSKSSRKWRNYINDVYRIAAEWQQFLEYSQAFTIAYAGTLIKLLQLPDDKHTGPKFLLGSDLSNESLGIDENLKPNESDRGTPQGLIQDVLIRFQIAQFYLHNLMEDVTTEMKSLAETNPP